MIAAIEAGGTKFVCALARPDGTIVARHRVPTTTPDSTFAQVRAFFARAAADHGAVAGIGVASFGPLDLDPASPGFGAFTTTPKPGWSGARWPDALAALAAPLALDSDVNAAALGEWAHGAGRGCATVAYTTVGTGIGSGVVHHGEPLRGFSHYETGHLPTPRDPADGFAGICPYHGGNCLEGLAAGPAITARGGAGAELIAGYLAHLAVTLVLTHMPERLVFGGGVMNTPGLLDALRRRTRERLAGYVPRLDRDLAEVIVAPGLGDDAGIVGAVMLGRKAAGLA